ncbi:MAG: OmpH family outer membrane protein, partial [Ferruginibacter sp.]
MKKIIPALLFAVILLTASNVRAQTKTAYISVNDMVSIMPETALINGKLDSYKKDSIQPKYNELMALYESDLKKYNDSLNTTAAVHKQLEEELTPIYYQLQNWDQLTNQAVEAKQNELLTPIYRKVYDAIKQVAKEKGYTHVANKEAYLVAPVGDDLI